ncbi:MAG: hypothetical protein DIZ78_02480 [endosymbiont of Escarpia spicata]|uniref:EAL domain-containing protein n=1 Tax=endosymbiont of Escarpia spicata TaxID=2200908 RepID=A0A370DQV5_9GAMM|nr:MAG: hypothetical protein DIZ78_02480 [endosymbiont of Escarpia spicata]
MGALPQKNKTSPPESTGIASGLSLRLMPRLQEQLQFQRDDGCDCVQGYLLDRPMSWEAIANYFSSEAGFYRVFQGGFS